MVCREISDRHRPIVSLHIANLASLYPEILKWLGKPALIFSFLCKSMTDPQIEFRDGKSDIDLLQLQALFDAHAFWAKGRSIADLQVAIEHSDPTISMWDGAKLIGFARATSDGIYRAMIWDVVIDESYRGLGLGRRLVNTLIQHPKLAVVERVYLTTSHQQHFYEKLGFVRNDTATMIWDRLAK
jgi:ribosomal protein S18 acetylase RimI-like enzyme